MNAPQADRDKVRIVKQADRLKNGVIAIEKGNGEVLYRCPCDRCETVSEAPFPPKASRDFLCKTCMKLVKRGKPGARHEIQKGESTFITPCDMCGDEERTDFMPMRGREFLCSLCYIEVKKERRAAAAADDKPTVKPQAELHHEPHVEVVQVQYVESEAAPEAVAAEAPLPEAPKRRGPARRRKVKKLGMGPNQHFLVRCDGCPNEVEVKFVPSEEEAFYCKTCFGNEDIAASLQRGDRKSKRKYDVRTFHNAECAECGKVEPVDFRPNPKNPYICDGCFQNRRMRS